VKHHLLLLVSILALLLLSYDSSAGRVIAARIQNQNGVTTGQPAEIAEADQLASQIVKLYNDEKYDEALPLAQRLLELRKRTVGPDHFLTGQALENLAEIFLAKGKKKEARAYYKQALPIFEKSAPEKKDVIVILERYVCAVADETENWPRRGRLGRRRPFRSILRIACSSFTTDTTATSWAPNSSKCRLLPFPQWPCSITSREV
jgi:tetratricopeptide (TPR) repeat protein